MQLVRNRERADDTIPNLCASDLGSPAIGAQEGLTQRSSAKLRDHAEKSIDNS